MWVVARRARNSIEDVMDDPGLEHAVDAIAVEVERISEGQRFTTRLLSEEARQSGDAARELPSHLPT
jgi:hypothetical protein